MEISGLQFHRIPVRWESVWDSWTVAGGTAGSAKPPVLLASIVFGLPVSNKHGDRAAAISVRTRSMTDQQRGPRAVLDYNQRDYDVSYGLL